MLPSGFFEYSPLTSAIRQLSFAIGPTAGAPGECLLTGKSVTVAYDKADPFRKLLDLVTEPDDKLYPFTAVPLVGKQIRQIGVLVVDNRFLWKEREIDAEDVAGLEAFAGLFALSIENVRLQQRTR